MRVRPAVSTCSAVYSSFARLMQFPAKNGGGAAALPHPLFTSQSLRKTLGHHAAAKGEDKMISWKQVLLILFLAAVTGNLAGRSLKPVTADCFPCRGFCATHPDAPQCRR